MSTNTARVTHGCNGWSAEQAYTLGILKYAAPFRLPILKWGKTAVTRDLWSSMLDPPTDPDESSSIPHAGSGTGPWGADYHMRAGHGTDP